MMNNWGRDSLSLHPSSLCQASYLAPVDVWRRRIEQGEGLFCGEGAMALSREQRDRYVSLLNDYGKRYGEGPVVLCRAPGRINLRGMHVDTHGGWLNLMTHQRDIVCVLGAGSAGAFTISNQDAAFPELHFTAPSGMDASDQTWDDFLNGPEGRRLKENGPEGWGRYLYGATLRYRKASPGVTGVCAVVDGTLPRGASLSSSAALCVAWLVGLAALEGQEWRAAALILAARDGEWFAGARTGTADQAAIVLGKAGQVLHVDLLAEDFSIDGARWLPFPDDLSVLVVASGATRELSGPARVAYARNRFAYSAALELMRRILSRAGGSPEQLARLDRLSRMDTEDLGGPGVLWSWMKEIPEYLDRDVLFAMGLPGLEKDYARLFGDLPLALQPESFPLRGPLLFGLSESARAKRFPAWLASGAWEQLGQSMYLGHDGDRITPQPGMGEWPPSFDDATLTRFENAGTELHEVSGYYGASSPALDFLVDAARHGGALGACLTGAGIAGAIVVLCHRADSEKVRAHMVSVLQSAAYAQCAGSPGPIDKAQAEEMVLENDGPPGAGILHTHI